MQVDDSGAKLPAYGVQIRSRTVPVEPSGAYTLPGVFVGHWQVYIEGLTLKCTSRMSSGRRQRL